MPTVLRCKISLWEELGDRKSPVFFAFSSLSCRQNFSECHKGKLQCHSYSGHNSPLHQGMWVSHWMHLYVKTFPVVSSPSNFLTRVALIFIKTTKHHHHSSCVSPSVLKFLTLPDVLLEPGVCKRSAAGCCPVVVRYTVDFVAGRAFQWGLLKTIKWSFFLSALYFSVFLQRGHDTKISSLIFIAC